VSWLFIRHSSFVIRHFVLLAPFFLFAFVIMMPTQTQLTWFGQAGFKIVTPSGNVLLIDPWLTNPKFARGENELAALDRCDLLFLTHGHSDHVGNSVEIARRTGAKLVTNADLAAAMTTVLGYPAEQAGNDTVGHIGGTLSLLDGEVSAQFVPATHGSYVQKDDNSPPVAAGPATGVVIAIRDGPTIYHTGDTGFFSDIARVADCREIDIMLVCIGDHFTMGPAGAADAVKAVNPKVAVPIHYGTFPVLTGTPEAFEGELKKRALKTELRVMDVGGTISI
jgi:L-ascorbate metabolism protein UlaG (beta-lactamase superfamily)